MKFKSTWIVAGIFLALAAYLFLVDEPRQEEQRVAEEQRDLLFPDFDAEQVNAVHLKNLHGEATVTRREQGGWQVVQPWQDRANEGRIRTLLSDLKNLRSERRVAEADADLQPFGLAEPEITVRTDGPELSLAVGSENPAGDARYLRAGEGPVLVAESPAVNGFLLQLEDLRSQDVVGEFPWEDATALEVHSGDGETVRLEKTDGTWLLRAPLQREANPDAVQPLIDKLRWAKINTFLTEDEPRSEEALQGGTRVTLQAGADTSVTVRLARVGDQVWAHRSGRDAYFTVPGDVLDVFAADPQELQRRRPVLVKAWKVNRVELQLGEETRYYAKSDGTWQRDGAELEDGEQENLQNLLDALEATKAQEVIVDPEPPAMYGLEPATVTLSLGDNDQEQHTLLLGTADGTVFARGDSGGPVYEMPAEYLERARALSSHPVEDVEQAPEGD